MRAAIICLAVCHAAAQYFAVRYQGGSFSVASSSQPFPLVGDVAAAGSYNRTMLSTGWDRLSLETNGAMPDAVQAYAAGMGEGFATGRDAYVYMRNQYSTAPLSSTVVAFMDKNLQWMMAEAQRLNGSDPQWEVVALTLRQFDGLRDGLNTAISDPSEKFTNAMLLSIVAMGDVFDLDAALNPRSERRREWRKMSKDAYDRWFAANTHCSALFKLTDDLSDIFFGHTAWYNFNTMYRVFKHLTLHYRAPLIRAKTVSYSSYPAMMSSFDDFYLTDNGLAVIETSLGVLNLTMYEGNIRTDLLPYWVRVMFATRTSDTAPQWAERIAVLNSGTYNNQWMVLDLKLFSPRTALPRNTMWVAEQLPGVVASRDVTDILQYGYFPSYNVPMNRTLFASAGYAEAVAKQGPEMNDYQTNVRGEIFRRRQATVDGRERFAHLMMYNDYERDPISRGNPLYAIASRVDLATPAQCFGGLDTKMSSWSMWREGQLILARSGPTDQQPTFSFNSTRAPCGPHAGLPTRFAFPFQKMRP